MSSQTLASHSGKGAQTASDLSTLFLTVSVEKVGVSHTALDLNIANCSLTAMHICLHLTVICFVSTCTQGFVEDLFIGGDIVIPLYLYLVSLD